MRCITMADFILNETYDLYCDGTNGPVVLKKDISLRDAMPWLRANCDERTTGNFYWNGNPVWFG